MPVSALPRAPPVTLHIALLLPSLFIVLPTSVGCRTIVELRYVRCRSTRKKLLDTISTYDVYVEAFVEYLLTPNTGGRGGGQ